MTATIPPGTPGAGDAARESPPAAVLAVIRIACPELSGRPPATGRTADPGGWCFGDVAVRVD
jgi:hypothetical protein